MPLVAIIEKALISSHSGVQVQNAKRYMPKEA